MVSCLRPAPNRLSGFLRGEDMLWFKHYTDNHRGRSIQHLMDAMGHKGLSYYILMEMCAEKLTKNKSDIVTEEDCVFYFHPRVLASNLRLSVAGVSSLLRHCDTLKLFSSEINSKEIKIFMPMLLNLLEKGYKKSPKKALFEDQKRTSDVDIDIELDVDEKEKVPAPKVEKQEKEQCLNYKHYFERFVWEDLGTGDTKISAIWPKVDKTFENEQAFLVFVNSIVTSKKYKQIETSQSKQRYFMAALKSEMKDRGVV
jgi:hypothetical protein